MKILVFSDSHGNVTNMKRAVQEECPDRIFHLGDVVRDAQELAEAFPQIPLEHVCGNCDGYCDVPAQLIADVEGKRIMLTHGHLYHVKLGIGALLEAARKAGVDAVLFGHTHEALCTQHDNLWVINPGSIRESWRSGYGVLEIMNGALTCHLMELK